MYLFEIVVPAAFAFPVLLLPIIPNLWHPHYFLSVPFSYILHTISPGLFPSFYPFSPITTHSRPFQPVSPNSCPASSRSSPASGCCICWSVVRRSACICTTTPTRWWQRHERSWNAQHCGTTPDPGEKNSKTIPLLGISSKEPAH